jgi:hypothetical protein
MMPKALIAATESAARHLEPFGPGRASSAITDGNRTVPG